MTFDLEAIQDSKRRLRARLAALPIGEKLRILDELREREISIREAVNTRDGSAIYLSWRNSMRGTDSPGAGGEIGSD